MNSDAASAPSPFFGNEAKQALRQSTAAQLRAVESSERRRRSEAAALRFLSSPEFHRARTVAAYVSFGLEVLTASVLEACLRMGKRLAVPRAIESERTLIFHHIDDLKTQLVPGPLKFREPDPARPEVNAAEFDIILVPGQAFDGSGMRLGRGAGYYDRFLSRPEVRAFRCALAFDLQIIPAVPCDAYDQPVQAIFTESREIRITR